MPRIDKDATSITRYVMIVDSSDGSPETGVDVTTLDMQYTRYGAAPAAKVDAASLGATDAAWDDNEMYEVDGTSSPGLYRVDWPDAAFADGVRLKRAVTEFGRNTGPRDYGDRRSGPGPYGLCHLARKGPVGHSKIDPRWRTD